MNSSKALLTLGFVFFAAGTTFLAVGLSTHILAFTVLGPSLMAVATIFLATSKVHERRAIDQPNCGGTSRGEV